MTNFLQDLVTEFNKSKFTGSIADDGENAAEIGGYTDTGCLMLNAVISGSLFKGFPTNKVTALAGEEATGKTFIALGIAKYHLDSNPDAQVVYFDTEAAITRDMLVDRDIDTKRVMIAEPATIEEFRTMALKIIGSYENIPEKKRPPMIMVLDSLGMLSSDKEVKDTEEGKDTRDMTKPQLLKGVFRVLTLRLAQAGIPLIVTNHVYDGIGKGNANYTPKEMSGGSGLKYASSSIIFLSKAQDAQGKGKDKVVKGNFITVKMNKSRLTREKIAVKLKLSFTEGLDRYYGLLDLGLKHGIIKALNKQSVELPDGTKVTVKALRLEPEKYWTTELLTKLDECAKKDFCYGKNDADDGTDDGEFDTESEIEED